MGVYERIAELCKERGIAITALEKELGFGRGSIGKMKNAKRPNAERLRKIADYFGVSLPQLIGGPVMTSKKNIIRLYTPNDAQTTVEKTDEKIQRIEMFTGKGTLYYLDEKTAERAQKYFEDPRYNVLFDALEDSPFENIELAAEILNRMKKTNPDG